MLSLFSPWFLHAKATHNFHFLNLYQALKGTEEKHCWGNPEPQVSVVKSQRKGARKGQKGSGRRAEVPGIVSCTYRKNNTALPFSLSAVEILCCKH